MKALIRYRTGMFALILVIILVTLYVAQNRQLLSPIIQQTRESIVSGDSSTAHEISSVYECEAPLYLAETFPPSPVTPPLPPKNDKPYHEPDHVCRHFADEFCKATDIIPEIKGCWYLRFDTHAINVIRFVDNQGKEWYCVVEPQGNTYYCMSANEWNSMRKNFEDWERWIQEELCKKYYKFNELECEWELPNMVDYCEDAIGRRCLRGSSPSICRTNEDSFKDMVCKCGLFTCKWEYGPLPKAGSTLETQS